MVFIIPIWHKFLSDIQQLRHQQYDANFYQMLQEIRLGNISQATWDKKQTQSLIRIACTYSPMQTNCWTDKPVS